MSARPPLVFKLATEEWELEQVHGLNYRTFVEEIPQHQPSPGERLVDRFHAENTYLICLRERQLLGMLAVRANRPFSLDQKLPDLDAHVPAGRKVCEVRLLAVRQGCRGAQVLPGLLALVWQLGSEKGYDLAVISATTRQLRLYRHLGFVPFGPLVGSGEALFQPMYVTLESFEGAARGFLRAVPGRSIALHAANFLPGPVSMRRTVRRAFERAPESTRDPAFEADFRATQGALRELVGCRHANLLLGSGTLANDVVAGQLSLLGGRGIVLSSGEFGGRLVGQARAFGLDVVTLERAWGEAIPLAAVRRELTRGPAIRWLWCVHCETSTGVLNDLPGLTALCAEHGVRLAVDCVSSLGTLPVDLGGVYLAAGSSGKGLRSYPGIGMVFHQHEVPPAAERLPRYLDLGYYRQQGGIPFTFSSNLLHALQAAVTGVDWQRRFAELRATSAWLRGALATSGLELVGQLAPTSPAVVTLALPGGADSARIGRLMEDAGFLLSYQSEYLRRRNWIQVCLMGEHSRERVEAVAAALPRAIATERASAGSESAGGDEREGWRRAAPSSPESGTTTPL